MSQQTISHYNKNAARYQAQYDALCASEVHQQWVNYLVNQIPGHALDVGAGSGRDATWLRDKGWQVTAIEPAEGLRTLGLQRTGPTVLWLNARLPELANLNAPAEGFDLILLSAVWMHLPPEQRPIAFNRLQHCLAKKGLMVITLRFGPSDPERPMYEVSVTELEALAREYGLGLQVPGVGFSDDKLKREDVSWKTVLLSAAGKDK